MCRIAVCIDHKQGGVRVDHDPNILPDRIFHVLRVQMHPDQIAAVSVRSFLQNFFPRYPTFIPPSLASEYPCILRMEKRVADDSKSVSHLLGVQKLFVIVPIHDKLILNRCGPECLLFKN
jgi:hypothetical protein